MSVDGLGGCIDHESSLRHGVDELLHVRRLEWRLRRRFDALPESQRTAYRLLQQEGLSLKRAATVLGTSVTAVKLRAHRAYVALRAVLRDAEQTS